MRSALMTTLAVLVNVTVLCLPATGQSENPAAQDLVIKSEVETAISMLQSISAKQQRGEMTLD